MKQTTSIKYEANDRKSYQSLADFIPGITATATLHPGLLTIVISESAAKEVGEYIDKNGLNFHINPIEVNEENIDTIIYNETTDAGTLRTIILRLLGNRKCLLEDVSRKSQELDNKKSFFEAMKNDLEMYKRWNKDHLEKDRRIKAQIKAIGVMINSIFPEEKV